MICFLDDLFLDRGDSYKGLKHRSSVSLPGHCHNLQRDGPADAFYYHPNEQFRSLSKFRCGPIQHMQRLPSRLLKFSHFSMSFQIIRKNVEP